MICVDPFHSFHCCILLHREIITLSSVPVFYFHWPGGVIFPILQMGKLGLRELKELCVGSVRNPLKLIPK
jgi:hypothetical protein